MPTTRWNSPETRKYKRKFAARNCRSETNPSLEGRQDEMLVHEAIGEEMQEPARHPADPAEVDEWRSPA